jgi:hypothetical protein
VTDLVYRTEQALLGALITNPGNAFTLRLWPQDFTDPRHQAIYAALTDTSARSLGGRMRDWLTRLLSSQARDAAAYLEDLPGLCPDPAHLASYAAMITQARDQRAGATRAEQAARESTPLAGAAAWLADKAEEASRKPRQTPGAADASSLPGDVARLARALRVTTRRLAQEHQGVPTRPLAPHAGIPGSSSPDPRAVRAPGSDRIPQRPGSISEYISARPLMNAEHLQDRVLADLMTRPGDGRDVVPWLSAEAFSEGPRRDLYGLIRQAITAREPVDPLIIAWHAAQQDAGPSPEFVLRTAAADPIPGTAAAIGRVLLADYVCTTRFGPDWTKSPQLTQPAAAKAPVSEVGNGQAAPATRTPGRQQAAAPALPRGPIPGTRDQGHAPGQAPAAAPAPMARPLPVPQQTDGPAPHM